MKRSLSWLAAFCLALAVMVGIPCAASAYAWRHHDARQDLCLLRRQLKYSSGTSAPVELLVTGNHRTGRMCYSLRSLNGQVWSFTPSERYTYHDGICRPSFASRNLFLGQVLKSTRHGVSTKSGLTRVYVYATRGSFRGSTYFNVPADQTQAC